MTLALFYYAALTVPTGAAALIGLGPDEPLRWRWAGALALAWAGFAFLWMPVSPHFSPAPLVHLLPGAALLTTTLVRRFSNRGIAVGLAGALVTTVCLLDVWTFDRTVYRPWKTWADAARVAYAPVPRGDRLPETGRGRGHIPVGSNASWDETFAEAKSRAYPDVDSTGAAPKRALASLHGLHDDFASRFVVEQGFGLFRVAHWQAFGTEELGEPRDRPLIPQASPGPMGDDRPAAAALLAGLGDEADPHGLLAWHVDRGVDFANAPGWGVTGRDPGYPYDEVAVPGSLMGQEEPFLIGFRPHAMRSEPPPLAGWSLRRVELIGLVLHDEPVAYPSESLPRMIAGGERETRRLTPFEEAALPRLAAGEWVVAAEEGDRLRAVGALPAAAACAECHGVEQGRLLGALSYDFARGAAAGGSADAVPK